MIVRELLVSFGAKLDPNSMKKVEEDAKGVAGVVQKLLSTAFVFGVGKSLLAINELASNVEENMNVINQSFGDSAESILLWAESFGDAAGRNKYEMQEMAGTMGALLNPLMGKNAELAAEMSMTVSQLAVDLGSFYNVADQNSLQALRSGLTGEAEPLKKFGIIMNQDTLAAFALTQGITKSVKAMDVAEKTALRYNFILDQTSAAQGDAIRTSEGWANAKKGLLSKLKEMATTAGLRVLPVMTKMVNGARKLVDFFSELTFRTSFFEAALISLGIVATAVGIKLLIAFAPVLIPMLKMVAIFALVVLVVEDFYTFLVGGDSAIGRFIDSIWGPGSAAEAVDYLKLAFEALVFFWDNVLKPGLASLWEGFKLFVGFLAESAVEGTKQLIEAFRELWDFLTPFFSWLSEELNATIDLILRFFDFSDKVAGKLGNLKKGGDFKFSGDDDKKGAAGSIFKSAPSGNTTTNNGNTTINNQTSVTVGSATSATANKIAKAATDSMSKLHKRTAAALTQRAGN